MMGEVAVNVYPMSICKYFNRHNIAYTGSSSLDTLTAGIKEGSVIVLIKWNDKTKLTSGWHVMTAIYTGGKYLVFKEVC